MRLDISVHDALGMAEVQTLQELQQDEGNGHTRHRPCRTRKCIAIDNNVMNNHAPS